MQGRVKRRVWASGLVFTVAAAGGLLVGNLAFPTLSAAAVSPGGTTRVSVTDDEAALAAASLDPAVSADGRYVAFTSYAPLDPFEGDGDETRDSDVYVRDTVGGDTMLVSHGRASASGGPGPKQPADGTSDQPSISADGRYIAFRTSASNIPAAGAPGDSRIVVCDRDPDGDGTFDTACRHTLVSRNDDDPRNPHLAGDGSLISYEVPPAGSDDVGLLRSRRPAGADGVLAAADPSTSVTPAADPSTSVTPAADPSASPSSSGGPDDPPAEPDDSEGDEDTGWIELVSLTNGDDGALLTPGPGDRTVVEGPARLAVGDADFPLYSYTGSALATGGGHLAFVALYYGGSGEDYAFRSAVFDYAVGGAVLTRLDVAGDGSPLPGRTRWFDEPALSGDGRRYAFADVDEDFEPVLRLYDRDPEGDGTLTGDGVALPTEIASRTTAGARAAGGSPAFSADGRYLAFTTPSLAMHNGVDDVRDSGRSCLNRGEGGSGQLPVSYCDVVVRDLVLDADRAAAGLPRLPAELASPSVRDRCEAHTPGATCEGTGTSGDAALTADGSAVVYASQAYDLIEADLNKSTDVFQRRFAPSLAADPVDLGTVPLGSAALADVDVRHVGFGPLTVADITVGGAQPGDFTVFPGETCTAGVLHTTGECVVSIRFRPAAIGPRAATVRLTPVRGTPLDITVGGVGAPAPAGGFGSTPAGLAFGPRGVLHTSPARSVTVTNTGDGPLTIGLVTLTGVTPADYRITADTCKGRVIAPAARCRIEVRHRPVAVGDRNAVLRIDHSGTLSHTVALTGTGTAPELRAAPNVIKVGEVVKVLGTNFPPDSTVTVGFPGLPSGLTVKVAADGTFTRPFVVMAHIETGKRPLTGAVVPASAPGLAGPLVATTDLLVVRGALQPPDFIFRN